MEIRQAEPGEADLLASLWLRARRAAVATIPLPVHSDDEVHRWFTEVVLPARGVSVAVRDGWPVALLVLDGGWIDQLYVDPDSTGQGIGAALLGRAKRRRPDGLLLWTFEANVGARRFYEAHGFVVTGRTTGDNEEGAPDVRYEWRPPSTSERTGRLG